MASLRTHHSNLDIEFAYPHFSQIFAAPTACGVTPLDRSNKNTPTWIQNSCFHRQRAQLQHDQQSKTTRLLHSLSYQDPLLKVSSKPSCPNFFNHRKHVAQHEKGVSVCYPFHSTSPLFKQDDTTSHLFLRSSQAPHNQKSLFSKRIHPANLSEAL